MLRVNIRLSEFYGGAFPRYNEIDHLITLRGLLILWIKNARSRMMNDLGHDLQRSIDFVNQTLERDYRIDTTSRLEGPKDLFEHYLYVVSNNWQSLAELRP